MLTGEAGEDKATTVDYVDNEIRIMVNNKALKSKTMNIIIMPKTYDSSKPKFIEEL